MKKYNYYVSAVFDGGTSSIDFEASTLKEAKIQLQVIKEYIKNMNSWDKAHTESIELYIDKQQINTDDMQNIYYRKLK